MQNIEEWSDNFGTQVSHGISNSVDVPSFYTFSPERLRFYKNGTRIRTRDLDTEPTYTDNKEDWLLEPESGDTVEIFTAERPRYVVGVDTVGTWAGYVSSGLSEGDTYRAGLNDKQDPQNAAFFEVNGGSDNRVVIISGDTEVASDTWEFPDGIDITRPIRWAIDFNWYGVGPYKFKLFYTDETASVGEKAVNKTVAELTVPNEKSTEDGNFHVWQEVEASSSNVALNAGSFGFLTKGNVSPTERTKASRIVGTDNYSGTGNYEPIAAMRIDKPRGNVFVQLSGIEAVPSGGDGELLAVVMPEDETDATDFITPPQHSPTNSVIEETTNITQFTDQDGNLVTDTANPNGYQVGFFATDVIETGGPPGSGSRTTTQARAIRPVYEDDEVVFLYKDDSATARDVNMVYNVEQLW